MSLSWRLSKPGAYWWRYAVFENANVLEKTKLAAIRLESELAKGTIQNPWPSDASFSRYEVLSPTIVVLAEDLALRSSSATAGHDTPTRLAQPAHAANPQ